MTIAYLNEYNALRLWCAPEGQQPYPQSPLYEANGADHYDPLEVFEQNLQLDGSIWLNPIEHAVNHLRDQATFPSGGTVAGHHAYSVGLFRHYERTGDTLSRDAALLVSRFAAGNSDETPVWWGDHPDSSRENAFSIRNKLVAESLGQPHRIRLEEQVDLGLNHIDWWTKPKGQRTYGLVVRSFMVGLTCQALIEYWDRYRDSRIPPMIQKAADYLWEYLWFPAGDPLPVDHAAWASWSYGTFRYGDIETGDGSPTNPILPNEIPPIDSIVEDPNSSIIAFKGPLSLSDQDNYYKYCHVLLGNERVTVSSYIGSLRQFRFEYPNYHFSIAPQNGTPFKIIPGADVSYPGWGIGWSGGNGAAPDLNLLIAPMYAWLSKYSKDPLGKDHYLSCFNEIMAGSVIRTGIGSQKVYNQTYIHSHKAMQWLSNIQPFTELIVKIPDKITRINEISDLFQVSLNGSTIDPIIVKLSDNHNGDFFPSILYLTTDSPKATFRYRPNSLGPKLVSLAIGSLNQILEYTPLDVAPIATTYSYILETPLIVGKRSKLRISLPEGTVVPKEAEAGLIIIRTWPYSNATIHYQDNDRIMENWEQWIWLSTENSFIDLTIIPQEPGEVFINFSNDIGLIDPPPIKMNTIEKGKLMIFDYQNKITFLEAI